MTLSRLTSSAAVRAALDEFDRTGRATFLQKHEFRPARDYYLVADGKRYDSKAIAGVAYGYQHPDEGILKPRVFSGGEATVGKKLADLGFTVEGPKEGIGGERARRQAMLNSLLEAGGLTELPPQTLRDIGVYGGAQGIWVDQKRTGPLTPGGVGIAVGVLHTGKTYADDLQDDGLIYHYPETDRGRKDEREAEALKFAEYYRLPIFVVLHSNKQSLRDVKLSWVADHDDASKQCVILFEEPSGTLPTAIEANAFRLSANRAEKQKTVTQRERSPVFHFEVVKRYGQQCVFCDISEARLLEAAHIKPVSENGSDDPRNGLVLCANHHKAFDAGLVGIDPTSHRLVDLRTGTDLSSLGISKSSIGGLRRKPHADALSWWWSKFGRHTN